MKSYNIQNYIRYKNDVAINIKEQKKNIKINKLIGKIIREKK